MVRYQDARAVLAILTHLISGDLEGVLIEQFTDIILIPCRGNCELVSIKHREPNQSGEIYRHALPGALKFLIGTLTAPHDHNTTQYLLAAAAAPIGHPTLGGAIDDLGLVTKCPSCGALAPR